MTTDWKALCAELLAWAEKTSSHYYKQADVLLRARAALAEPVGEGARELQWPASVAQGCHEAAAEAESGSPLQQLLVAAGDLLERGRRRTAALAPQHNPWKEILLDALVCNFLLEKEHENDPKKALNDLIAWEKQLATDPLINPAPLPEQEVSK